ncbi:MAG: PaaI family thioesterase [Bacilli bacterium]
MKVVSKQYNSRMCIICGMENENGVKAQFYNMEDDSVMTLFQYKETHQSYPGRVHGGMITCMLDELVGRALWVKHPDEFGVTMSLTTHYRKPVPYGVTLKGIGRVVKDGPKFFVGSAEIQDLEGNVLANAEANYFKLPVSKIGENISVHKDLDVFIKDDVKEIN